MYSLQEDFHTVLVTSKMPRIVEQACRVWGIIQNDARQYMYISLHGGHFLISMVLVPIIIMSEAHVHAIGHGAYLP